MVNRREKPQDLAALGSQVKVRGVNKRFVTEEPLKDYKVQLKNETRVAASFTAHHLIYMIFYRSVYVLNFFSVL